MDTTTPPTGGTALIVVPGVGDDAQGDTVGAMRRGLVAQIGEGAHATSFARTILVPPLPGSDDAPTTHDVCCAAIHRPGETTPVVAYEMHWADLSRFPGASLLRFVLTLYGMLFQITTIGIEAFRATSPGRWPQQAIRVFSYLTAVVVVGTTAGAAILGVELAAMVRLRGHDQQLAIAGGALLLLAALAWYGDGFLRARGWRFGSRWWHPGRPGVAFGLIALGAGVVPLLLHAVDGGDGDRAVAVHEVLWFAVRWALPVPWMLVGAVAIATALTMLAVLPGEGPAEDPAPGRYGATRTALLSVVIGGLGIALLGAVLVAAGLALTTQLAGAATAVPARAAADVTGGDRPFGGYSQDVFLYSLRPLGVALLCTLVLLGVIVIAGFRYFSAFAQASMSPAEPLEGAPAVAVSTVATAGLAVAMLRGSSTMGQSLAVVLLLVALVLAAVYWSRRFRPSPGRAPFRRGFAVLLDYLGSVWHALLLSGALLVAASALMVALPWTQGPGDGLGRMSSRLFAPLADVVGGSALGSGIRVSATIAVLVALGALIRRRLSVAAKGLDIAYDVATYVRIPHGTPGAEPVEPPRRRILRRYAALIEHIQRVQKPERIVIAAHSQGSMYSIALLFGDEFRDRADQQEADGWPLAPRVLPDSDRVSREPAPRIAVPMTLVTAGCPILQTYAPSFPGQYDWAGRQDVVRRMLAGVGPHTTWRNVYRSGDYLGRALWSPEVCAPVGAGDALQEFCLGPGQHTGYWDDPRFARHVLAQI